jgi:stress-induced-phosphoprotein 1
LKAQGNELYKARKFEAAIEAYSKALELFDGDVSFLTNRCGMVAIVTNYNRSLFGCCVSNVHDYQKCL